MAGDSAGGEDDMDDFGFNVWSFFTSSAYSGFDDDEGGFFQVYAKSFADIAADEAKHSETRRPPFGNSKSERAVVRDFYAWWEGFCTARSCANADQYDTRAAPNRQIRRAMEKENDKVPTQAHPAYHTGVHCYHCRPTAARPPLPPSRCCPPSAAARPPLRAHHCPPRLA